MVDKVLSRHMNPQDLERDKNARAHQHRRGPVCALDVPDVRVIRLGFLVFGQHESVAIELLRRPHARPMGRRMATGAQQPLHHCDKLADMWWQRHDEEREQGHTTPSFGKFRMRIVPWQGGTYNDAINMTEWIVQAPNEAVAAPSNTPTNRSSPFNSHPPSRTTNLVVSHVPLPPPPPAAALGPGAPRSRRRRLPESDHPCRAGSPSSLRRTLTLPSRLQPMLTSRCTIRGRTPSLWFPRPSSRRIAPS